MGQKYTEISQKHVAFIENQKVFFVASATEDSRVNISPKGMDSLRILDKNRVAWLNVTGSGNETSAHVQQHPRMTIMFSAFEGNPMILRLYGKAKVVHRGDSEWKDLSLHFRPIPGARQIFDVAIDLVQVSCGMAVPRFDYVSDRDQLNDWALKKGQAGLEEYWQQKNELSLDGEPTNLVKKSS